LSSPAVEAIAVHKRFGQTIAVKEVNLSVGAGEFFSLLGPSGCGKTTLLRMIAGFEEPTSGKILVAGREMVGVRPHRRPVNMVFQSYALFPHLSVFDNVAFGLRQGKEVGKADIPARVNEALALVRLPGMADRMPAQLSGGQQQRVALARAIVNRPTVLLLDEPLSALDLKIRQEMQEELARLKRELAITFIMVTHDQGEALALSNRLAVFYQGNLEQVGTPEEIYGQPRTPFVADFIGQTNLIKATVSSRDGQGMRVVTAAGRELAVRDSEDNKRCAIGGGVTIWARTRAIALAPWTPEACSQGDPARNVFEGVVSGRSYLGDTTELRVEVSGGLSLRASMPGGCTFSIGDRVVASLPVSETGVVLEDESGEPGGAPALDAVAAEP